MVSNNAVSKVPVSVHDLSHFAIALDVIPPDPPLQILLVQNLLFDGFFQVCKSLEQPQLQSIQRKLPIPQKLSNQGPHACDSRYPLIYFLWVYFRSFSIHITGIIYYIFFFSFFVT